MTPLAHGSALAPRRVLTTRQSRWAKTLAHRLGQSGVRPNTVSLLGIGFALAASVAFYVSPGFTRMIQAMMLLLAAASIQLRLLCNLLDGMLAVEGGFKTRTGEIYNELPDRLADIFILVGAGYSVRSLAFGTTLGWAAAAAALLTAYVRALGGALGLTQHFIGPMAKQHRMFALTVSALLAAVEAIFGLPPRAIRIGLAVVVAGSIVTVFRRTSRIADELNAR